MKARLLIVDDELEIRDMLSRHFRYLGFQVDTASDGIEAMEKLRMLQTMNPACSEDLYGR